MSSLVRRLQRKPNRSRSAIAPGEEKPRQHRMNPDGGYSYLHETKGWKRVSPKRLGVR